MKSLNNMPASAGTPILKTKTKRTFAFLLLLVALLAPWAAVGQSQTLTVCDGTNNNEHVPFEAFSAVNAQHNQMIFPATELAAMNGQNITQMVFYIDKNASSSLSSYDDLGTWTISLGETSATTLNGLDKTTALTQVFQGELNYQASTFSHSAGTLTIPIDEYIYHGGNLLVDLNHATSKHNYTWYFLGQSQSGVTAISSSPHSASTHQFLPKTTFSYEAPPTNPKPSGLTCSTYTANTATLVWTENGNATMWDVQWSKENVYFNQNNRRGISTPYIHLTDLTPETTYYARVRARYSDTETSDWSLICEFKPSQVHIVEIGLPSHTSEELPTNPYYHYSYTQQIYTATEIDQPGTIKSVSFKGDETGTRNLVVYMANTTKESFANTSDVIPISEAQQVFSGNVDFTDDEWTKITFSGNGFDYTGDNLAIIVDDNSEDDSMGETYWSTFTASSNQAVYFYQDWTNIDPANPSAKQNDITTSKNQIKLDIVPTTFPRPTNLAVSNITTDGATITWQAHSSATPTGYEYMYKAATGTWPDSWTSNQNQTSVNLTGLSAYTTYNFRVRAVYSTEYSVAAETNFTTDYEAIATFPWVENFNGLTEYYSIPDFWDNSEGTPTDDSYKWCYNKSTSGNGATNGTSHDGSKCVRFDSYRNPNGNINFLKTPTLSLPANERIQLSFWWKNPNGGDFSVYISTDGGETHEMALATGLRGQTTWVQRIIDLTDFAGQEEVVIVFKGTSNQGLYDAYIYLDDVEIALVRTFTKNITGYGTSEKGGYHLIASPLAGQTNATNVQNMINTNPNDFDLYRFDQSAELEWKNWKETGEHYHFNLESGQGYLYASKENTELSFTGVAYSGNGQVTLNKVAGASFEGLNLVGNPFATAATITKPFYRMNSDGSEIIPAVSNSIAPMEGIFVVADTDGETLTFSQATRATNDGERIVVDLSRPSTGSGTGSTSAIDRTIVRFGEGHTLPKLQLFENSTKVYIPQDGKDYAIVSVGRDGVHNTFMGRDGVHTVSTEIPLNFKAEKNGTYTLSFSLENVDLDYLHLIDNLAGANVDLLVGPSTGSGASEPTTYTFTAKTTDYASRFRLVFAAAADDEDGASTGSATFAYISNGNIIVNGEGTLQVVDATGRVVRCRDGVHTVSTSGMAPGVYVLRLINGDDVRTQKIVVE